MNKNDLGKSPAFPHRIEISNYNKHVNELDIPGMDLRTYIATKAMQGLCALPKKTDVVFDSMDAAFADLAKNAVLMADALIAELSKNA